MVMLYSGVWLIPIFFSLMVFFFSSMAFFTISSCSLVSSRYPLTCSCGVSVILNIILPSLLIQRLYPCLKFILRGSGLFSYILSFFASPFFFSSLKDLWVSLAFAMILCFVFASRGVWRSFSFISWLFKSLSRVLLKSFSGFEHCLVYPCCVSFFDDQFSYCCLYCCYHFCVFHFLPHTNLLDRPFKENGFSVVSTMAKPHISE